MTMMNRRSLLAAGCAAAALSCAPAALLAAAPAYQVILPLIHISEPTRPY